MEDKRKNNVFRICSCIIAVLVIALVIGILPQMQLKANKNVSNNYGDERVLGDTTNCTSWKYPNCEQRYNETLDVYVTGTPSDANGQRVCTYNGDFGNAGNTIVYFGTCTSCASGYTLSGGTCVRNVENDASIGYCLNPTYNGNMQYVAANGQNTTMNNAYQKDQGFYVVSYTPTAGHAWSDGTTSAKTLSCRIISQSACGAGQGADPSATTGCSNCSTGYYSPANDNECHMCQPGYTTSGSGKSSESDCNVCTSGYHKEGTNCVKDTASTTCPAGEYYDSNNDNCKPCPSGYTDSPAGTVGRDACYRTVPAGQGHIEGSSSSSPVGECPIGTYSGGGKDYAGSGTKVYCTSCGSGKTTSSRGSTSSTQCQTISISASCNKTSLKVGETTSCSATVTPNGAGNVRWTVNGTGVSISGGTLTAQSVGTSTVYAVLDSDSNIKSSAITINVTAPTSPICAESINLTCSSLSVRVGDTINCGVNSANGITPSYATNKGTITYSGSDSSVASISSSNGTGKALKAGTITVTATLPASNSCSSLTSSRTITVAEADTTEKCYCNLSRSSCRWTDHAEHPYSMAWTQITDANTCNNISEQKCFCKTDGSSCTWQTSESGDFPVPDYSVLDETTCVNVGRSTSKDCKITSVTTTSQKTSLRKDAVDNSHYVVNVTVSGSGCRNQRINYSATNSKTVIPVTEVIGGASTYSFKVYPAYPCIMSTATAKLANGNSGSTSVEIIEEDWIDSKVCEQHPTYTSFTAADAAGADVYYSDYKTCDDGVTQGYTVRWDRSTSCGKNGGGGNTPSPNPTYACYANTKNIKDASKVDWLTGPKDDLTFVITNALDGTKITKDNYTTTCVAPNKYCYANADTLEKATQAEMLTDDDYKEKMKDTSFKLRYIVKDSSGNVIRNSYDCTPSACYENKTTGDMKWAKAGTLDNSYTKIDVYKESECKKQEACLAKQGKDGSYDDFHWASTKADIDKYANLGYKILDKVSFSSCIDGACYKNGTDVIWVPGGTDVPAGYTKTANSECETTPPPTYSDNQCYVHKKSDGSVEYVWGTYSSSDYSPIDIEQKYCLTSKYCYMNTKDEKYYNGDYSMNNDYILVSDDNCKIVPAPKTAVNVNTMVYIGMIVLAFAGIGLIYYGNYKRKNY